MASHYPPNIRKSRIQEDLVHKCDDPVMNKETMHGSIGTDNIATCKDGSDAIQLINGETGKIVGDDFEIKFGQWSHVDISESGVEIEDKNNNHQEVNYEF